MEADDLIAALVKTRARAGMRVVIVSSDKDLMQLVGDGVSMFDTVRNLVFGAAGDRAEAGRPARAGARLPGAGRRQRPTTCRACRRSGPRPRCSCCSQFGDLDGSTPTLDHVERSGVREKLADASRAGVLRASLVTLDDSMTLRSRRTSWRVRPAGRAAPARLFTELGFTRLSRERRRHELGITAAASPAEPSRGARQRSSCR